MGSLAAAKEAASSACWHEREGLFEMPKATLASHTPRHGVVVVVLGVVVGVVVVAWGVGGVPGSSGKVAHCLPSVKCGMGWRHSVARLKE